MLGPLTVQLMLMIFLRAHNARLAGVCWGPWATHPAAVAHDARLCGLTMRVLLGYAGVLGPLTLQLMLMMRVLASSLRSEARRAAADATHILQLMLMMRVCVVS